MNEGPFEIATLHPGWIASAVTTLWAIGLRVLIGRHYKAMDDVKEQLRSLGDDLTHVKGDVANMKGRFEERDRVNSTYRGPRRRFSDTIPGDRR